MADDPEKLFIADMGGIFAQHAGIAGRLGTFEAELERAHEAELEAADDV